MEKSPKGRFFSIGLVFLEEKVYTKNIGYESFELQIVVRLSLIKVLSKCYLRLTVTRSCFFLENMIPRFKKVQKVTNQHLKKEEFLEEHNRLSPINLRATISLLSRFRTEKSSLFKGDDWSIDKLRRPFVLWLTSSVLKEKENVKEG